MDGSVTATPPTTTPIPEALRTFADKLGLSVGTHVNPNLSQEPFNQDLVLREFNSITPSVFSWDWVYRNGFDQPDYGLADRWTSFAKDHGLLVRGQPLLGQTGFPKWLVNSSFSPDEMKNVIATHIQRHMNRYPSVAEWVVVNEPLWAARGAEGYKPSPWLEALGPDYVPFAFGAARATGVPAKLMYNDGGGEVASPKAEAVFRLVSSLKSQNMVDMVGLQMHVDGGLMGNPNTPDPEHFPPAAAVLEQMSRYKAIGVLAAITEMDVDTSKLQGGEEERLARQADIYATVTQAVVNSDNCVGMSFWGYDDRSSWLLKAGGRAPLLFNESGPKPAYYAVLNVLKTAANSP
jgi:endo-1,4-beta-xylanase